MIAERFWYESEGFLRSFDLALFWIVIISICELLIRMLRELLIQNSICWAGWKGRKFEASICIESSLISANWGRKALQTDKEDLPLPNSWLATCTLLLFSCVCYLIEFKYTLLKTRLEVGGSSAAMKNASNILFPSSRRLLFDFNNHG